MNSINRIRPAAALSLLLVALLSTTAWPGINETPGQNYRPHRFGYFSPNLWEFGGVDIGIFQHIVVGSQHYTQGAGYEDDTHDLSPGGAGVWNFFTFCTNRAHDVMLVTSHGWNDPTTSIEMYPWTARGRAVRDSTLAYWNGIFVAGSFIRNWAGILQDR
jgi:hypothetical protein